MKRGPQPKRAFNAEQSRARAGKIRALAGVVSNDRVRAGLERLAAKFDKRAAVLDGSKSARCPAPR